MLEFWAEPSWVVNCSWFVHMCALNFLIYAHFSEKIAGFTISGAD